MTREEYNKSIEAQLKRVKETLIKKNKEYSTDNSPLHNFHHTTSTRVRKSYEYHQKNVRSPLW